MQHETVKLEIPVSNITADSLAEYAKDFGVSASKLSAYILHKGFSDLANANPPCEECKKEGLN